jgi:hypothetical protein
MNSNPFGTPPAAQAAAPAPFAAADHRAALAGLDAATGETRLPWLAPGFNCRVQIDLERLINGLEIGTAFVQEFEILAVQERVAVSSEERMSWPEGSQAPTVGGTYALKISGFNSVKARTFALNDLKAHMRVALARYNLTEIVTPAGEIKVTLTHNGQTWTGDWIEASIAMCRDNLAVGVVADVFTSLTAHGKQSGKRKVKAIWRAVPAV